MKKTKCLTKVILIGIFLFSIISSKNSFAVQWGDPIENTVDHWGLTYADGKYNLEKKIADFKDKFKKEGKNTEELDYVPGIETTLRKVFKQKTFFKGIIDNEVFLNSAKNEYEGFQLCIFPIAEKDIKGIRLEFADLVNKKTGNKISKDKINSYVVDYVETVRPTYPTMHVGWWPEILWHKKSIDVNKAEVQPFWIEIYTPKTVSSGIYEGEVVIITANCLLQKVKIYLNVWGFTLPDNPEIKINTWINSNEIKKRYGEEKEEEIFKKCCEFLLDHKIQPISLVQYYWGKHKNNLSLFDKHIQYFLDKGLNHFHISLDKKLYQHLKKKDWLRYAWLWWPCLGPDEPREEDYPKIREKGLEVAKLYPGLRRTMDTRPSVSLFGAIDCWMLAFGTYDEKVMRERQEAGDEIWWYQCGIPIHCDFNRPYWEYPSSCCIDRPSIDYRIVSWMLWQYKVKVMFFNAGNYWRRYIFDKDESRQVWADLNKNWPETPWSAVDDYSHTTQYGGIYNGDSFSFYPGKDSPIPSIRIKCIRDGIEDYQYLTILRDAVNFNGGIKNKYKKEIGEAKKLLSIEHSLFVNTHYYSKDPKMLLNYREKIAKEILRMKEIKED